MSMITGLVVGSILLMAFAVAVAWLAIQAQRLEKRNQDDNP